MEPKTVEMILEKHPESTDLLKFVEGFASASLSQVSLYYYCCATVIMVRHLT